MFALHPRHECRGFSARRINHQLISSSKTPFASLRYNDLVRKLGQANLTMATIAQIYAFIGKKIHIAKMG